MIVVVASLAAVAGTIGCAGSRANGDGGSTDFAIGGDGAADLGARDLASGGSGGVDGGGGSGPTWVYVSGYSTTIARYVLDESSGALTAMGTTTATGTPSFLAFDAARRHVYAVDEANSVVEAFAVDATTGALTHVGTDRASGGSGPAHVAVDPSGGWVLAANYGSGDVGVLPIGAGDGSLGAGTSLHAGVNSHEVVFASAGGATVAWVPCLGSQYIAQYSWNAGSGTLTALTGAATVMTPAGAGPRHLALAPSGAFAYLVEETDSMIAQYSVGANGGLTLVQRMSSRATGATGTNTGAEVALHPSGKWLYVSNRGDNDLGVFAVGAADGKLSPLLHVKTGGTTPRHFSLDAAGGSKWLLVADQGSGDVRVFAVDGATGLLAATGTMVTATMPSYVGAVKLAP